MKMIFSAILVLLSVNVLASDSNRELQYWCDPDQRFEGLEAVLVSEINGETHIEVYTEADSWGAVDQKIEKAGLSITNNHTYNSLSNTVSLTILTKGLTPSTPQTFFEAKFVDTELNYNMRMFCEYLP